MNPRVTGGTKLAAFVRDVESSQRSRRPSAQIGYFPGDRYPDGTSVAFVALVAEFGSENNVESAAMRRAIGSRVVRAKMVAELRPRVQSAHRTARPGGHGPSSGDTRCGDSEESAGAHRAAG